MTAKGPSTTTTKPSPLQREVGDRAGEATTLNNIGRVLDGSWVIGRGRSTTTTKPSPSP